MADYAGLVRKAMKAAAGAGSGYAASSPDDAEASFLGRMARGANLKKLEQAERMAKQGDDRSKIFSETGWFQGADKQWRYGFPDIASTFKSVKGDYRRPFGNVDEEIRGTKISMTDRLRHPELYRAYPELRETGFLGFPSYLSPETKAFVDSTTGPRPVIGMSSALKPDEARSSALHEMQHRIQNIEGFAPGGNLQSAPVVASVGRELGMSSPTYEEVARAQGGKSKLFDAYQRLAGEVEARNVQWRADFPQSLMTPPPWMTQGVPDAEQILLPSMPYQFRFPFVNVPPRKK